MKKLILCIAVTLIFSAIPVMAGEAEAPADAIAEATQTEEMSAAPEESAPASIFARNESAAALVEDIPTVQAYTDEPVAEEDILKILNAGINAPSAMNGQPWFFTVVTDKKVLEAIASEGDKSSYNRAGVPQIPLAIVISIKEGANYDAGLAAQAMSVEAQLLGYGTKFFFSVQPTMNGAREQEFREMLHIPDGYYAFMVLSIGKQDMTVDAASTATGRYPAEYMVTYITP